MLCYTINATTYDETQLMFIGHGGDKKAKEYNEFLHLQGDLYLDQKRQSHALLNLKDAGILQSRRLSVLIFWFNFLIRLVWFT